MANLIMDTPSRHVYTGDGSTRVFPIPTLIEGDDWIRIEINGEHQIDRSKWDIVNNSIIFVTAPEAEATVDVLVASSIEAMTQFGSTSAIDIVAQNINNVNLVGQEIEAIINVSDNLDIVSEGFEEVKVVAESIGDVNIVADNITSINELADMDTQIDTLYTDIANINNVGNSIDNVNIVASKTPELTHLSENIDKVDDIALYSTQIQIVGNDLANSFEYLDDYGLITDAVATEINDISNIETVATNIDAIIDVTTFKDEIIVVSTNIGDVNTVATNIDDINTVVDNIVDIQNSTENVIRAKEEAWKAEAERLTAQSYATEPENVFVKAYTSNNDGTFTITDTTDYSASHWEKKASDLVTTGIIDDVISASNRTYSSYKIEDIVNTINTNITTIVTDNITPIENTIDTIEGDIVALEGRATGVEGRATTIEGDIDTIEGDIAALEDRATDVEGRTTTLEGSVSTLNSTVVKLTGNQTIVGTKTFTSNPLVSLPTLDAQVANKLYVDNKVIAAGAQPTMTGHAVMNGDTNNNITMNDIVSTLGLEVGDVVRIQYSGYDKLHSIESITGTYAITVNYEHAGNRCNGSLRLPTISTNITVTRVAKWYNAPLGLGKAWVTVGALRNNEINYTNSTGRAIIAYIAFAQPGGSAGVPNAIQIDGVSVGFSAGAATTPNTISVPPGSVYRVNTGRSVTTWTELR